MNQRDLELLSAYLDGQLSPSDSARLEARLKSDGQLASTLDDLRAARTFLRQLPKRRAPRNFTLTRKMVGLNPPLPRAYPAFRFATVVATLLFFFTFGVNAFVTQLSQPSAFGMGGGAAPEVQAPELFSQQAAPVAATEEAAIAQSGPALEMTAPAEDSIRVMDTPAAKLGDEANAEGENQPQIANEAQRSPAPFIPRVWMVLFAVVAMVGSIFMAMMRRSSMNRWK